MTYRKLKFKEKGLVGQNSLWMGEDHLLQVSLSACTERYRRFFFKDIQNVVITPGRERLITNVVCGIFLLGFAGLAVVTRNVEVAPYIFVVMDVVLLIAMLVNTLKGQGARVHILTAAGLTSLQAVKRMPKARRLCDQLAQEISAVQGTEMPTPSGPATFEPEATASDVGPSETDAEDHPGPETGAV